MDATEMLDDTLKSQRGREMEIRKLESGARLTEKKATTKQVWNSNWDGAH